MPNTDDRHSAELGDRVRLPVELRGLQERTGIAEGPDATMFLAFVHRKIGRWDSETQDAITRDSEDSLTAMVLGRLRYLPVAAAWRLLVLDAQRIRGEYPQQPKRSSLEFWPRVRDVRRGRGEVEPDVLWVDDHSVLIVEVKWRGKQTVGQLEAQYAAVSARYPDRRVTVLALGGIDAGVRSKLLESSTIPRLLILEWERLADRARAICRETDDDPERAVLQDIVSILEWRGLVGIESLKTLQSLPSWKILPRLRPFLRRGAAASAGKRTFDDLRKFPPVRLAALKRWRPTP